MRALLDCWEDTAPAAAAQPPQAAWRANDKPAKPPAPAVAPSGAATPPSKATELAAWEQLRLAVREARTARGLSIEVLVSELGLARSTLQAAVQTRALPSMRLRRLLTEWLAAAPEVAAEPAATFRAGGNGTGNGNGNGADHPDTGHRSGLHLG